MKVRQQLRINADLPANVCIFGEESEAESMLIRNISTGGVFLETANLLSLDTLVEIEFSLPGSEKPIQVVGYVKWLSKEKSGMGIRFLSLAQIDQQAIISFTTHQGRRDAAVLSGFF